MSGARPAVSDVDVDLGKLFGSLARNWLRILVAALVVAAIAFVLAMMATPLYRAETRILIEERESFYTRPANMATEADRPLLDEQAIASQVEVISSPDILRNVARSLDLASRPEFTAAGEPSALGNLLVMLGLRNDPSQASAEERVLDKLREDLLVYQVGTSRVIIIQFSSADPELAAAVPNAVADAYVEVQERAKRMSNAAATAWLEPEIEDLRQRVREAEARVAEYRAENDLLIGQSNAVLATQQLSELSSELTRARAARSAAEAKANAVRAALESGDGLDTLPEVLGSPLVQRLRERQAQVSAELADQSAALLGNHPRIRALNAQLAEIEAQVRDEMRTVLSSLENEVATAQAQERRLIADLSRLKAQAAQAGSDEVELRALEREAAAQRALLESYLTRYKEAASRAARNYLPADARIFRARTPYEPYFPKVVPIAGSAFAGALLVIVIITLLRELFSGRAMRPAQAFAPVEQVRMPEVAQREPEPEAASQEDVADQPEPEDVEERQEPVAEEEEPEQQRIEAEPLTRTDVPVVEEAETEFEATDELSIIAAADRLVASGTVRAVFLSPEGDEACATSVMVAREVSDAGLRVLFLDLTYSGAPSASMLDSGRYPGITNLLASEAQFADIIHGDLYSECHVIPLGTADPQQALRAIDRLPIVMSSLTTAYDMVVVECGATDAAGLRRIVGEGTEVMIGAIRPGDRTVAETAANLRDNGYDGVLLVSPAGYTQPPAPEGRSAA